jgi:hypothetical protein
LRAVTLVFMTVERWWPKLRPETREWLIANNGDAVPVEIVDEIVAAGGPAPEDSWWARAENPSGPVMPDSAIDWIEEVANQEIPPD